MGQRWAWLLAILATACGVANPGTAGNTANQTDTADGGLPAAKPGSFDDTCKASAATHVSSASCRTLCQSDAKFQAFLACIPIGGGKCFDLSFLAPGCTPFTGACTCDALSAMECWQCANGGVTITIPDRKFYAIEAVTAFPAQIDASGKVVGRVCGAALDPSDPSLPPEPAPSAANGFEVTANFVASSLWHPACADDQDTAIQDGELINLRPVSASGAHALPPSDFTFALRCSGTVGDLSGCTTPEQDLIASGISYHRFAKRCDPADLPGTSVNVALILDNSGSTKGNVDKETLKEGPDGGYDPALAPLTTVASDWHGARFDAAQMLISGLNTHDRVVGYLFDENGPHIASSDAYICTTDDFSFSGAWCHPDDPTTCPAPGTCDQDPTEANDSYAGSLDGAQCKAFGASSAQRADLANGIGLKRYGATGRAPLWQAVSTAFEFLSSGGSACPDAAFGALQAMHIVVLTDGPDTCTDGDDFSYQSLKNSDTSGKCRVPCAGSTVAWHDLLVKMAKAGYPVHVHFIQFQAPGYKDPDPRMLEMACRTDGTYQFINSENFNKSTSSVFADAIARAENRVRNGLAGTWRVGFKWPAQTEPLLATGQLAAIDGDFRFTDTQFQSLDPAVHDLGPDAWRFTINGDEDRRALLRTPCTSDGDCGGTTSCAAKHCGEGGVCRSDPAPNGEPCPGGTCRNGACIAGATCADAVKP